MGLPRSTFYDVPAATVGDVELVAKIVVICDEFETYGYRRVRAELCHQGFVVNGKKIRRLMRENRACAARLAILLRCSGDIF